MCDINDVVLLNRLQNGDEKAFDEIYLKYKELAVLFTRSILKTSMHHADDLVQDIFIEWWQKRILQNLVLNDKNFSLKPFLKKSIKYKCIDYFRKRNSDINREEKYSITKDTIEMNVDTKEMEQHITMYLNCLKQTQKNFFTLKYLKEYKIKEIAVECGVTTQIVRNNLHLGIKKIRKNLGIE